MPPFQGTREIEELALSAGAMRDQLVDSIDRLKEIDRLKQEFMSVVTHELKTPLTSIEGYTKLLLMGKGGALSEKQRSILSVIAEQSGILKNMIQDLLDIRRLETGRLPLSRTRMAFGDILHSAYQAHAGEARAKGLRFELRLDPAAESAIVDVDPFRMQQVIGNLLQNAFKFTPNGGEVALAAGRSEEQVWFSVSDTGSGIPPDALPRLFERFFQVDAGDVRVSGGAGLGLYISRELVNSHGGEIEVTSTEGKGSTFTVRLPSADRHPDVKGRAAQP
jgi:signal transduction histidine kinase